MTIPFPDLIYPLTRAAKLAALIDRRQLTWSLAEERAFIGRVELPMRVWHRAEKGRVIAAEPLLRLCAGLGVDPMTIEPPCPASPMAGDIQWLSVGTSLGVNMAMRGHGVREAAAACGVSTATISRAARGMETAFDSLARVALYCGQHPHDFTGPGRPGAAAQPACSTGNTHCNRLKIKGDAHA